MYHIPFCGIIYIYIDDTYLQYIQFRIGIKDSFLRTFCCQEEDSIEQMIFLCPKIDTFWNSIHVWLG